MKIPKQYLKARQRMIAKARKLKDLGLSYRDIGLQLGVSHQWVSNVLTDDKLCVMTVKQVDNK